MRTTVTIEDKLLVAARGRALERNTTLGRVIEDALRLALDTRREGAPPRAALPVSPRRGGTRPGIDIHDGVRLRDALDADPA